MNSENLDASMKGPGGAPTRATTLPTDAQERKKYPIASGVLNYFPDAMVALAALSQKGNDQHNPGKPLQWDRSKSGDEADTLMRHFLQRGLPDKDGVSHTVKVAWRALAMLQKEIESQQNAAPAAKQYPRYWLYQASLSSAAYIYRSLHPDDVGSIYNRGWVKCGVSGVRMDDFAASRPHLYAEITAERAAALGADITKA